MPPIPPTFTEALTDLTSLLELKARLGEATPRCTRINNLFDHKLRTASLLDLSPARVLSLQDLPTLATIYNAVQNMVEPNGEIYDIIQEQLDYLIEQWGEKGAWRPNGESLRKLIGFRGAIAGIEERLDEAIKLVENRLVQDAVALNKVRVWIWVCGLCMLTDLCAVGFAGGLSCVRWSGGRRG